MLKRFPYKWVVAAVFVMALFMDILDMTIVNVSLVAIGKSFKVGVALTSAAGVAALFVRDSDAAATFGAGSTQAAKAEVPS